MPGMTLAAEVQSANALGAWQHGAGQQARPVARIPSLLFDLELQEQEQKGKEDSSVCVAELKRYMLPMSTGELKLRADVETAMAKAQPDQQPADTIQHVARYLAQRGYAVAIRQAVGGGQGDACLRNLKHTFLTVCPPGAAASATNRYVVDLAFREQFLIAKPTPRYAALLGCLPSVHVCPESMLAPLVNLMSQEMAAAFHSNGAVLPPWRQPAAMLSKWAPRKSIDEQVQVKGTTATTPAPTPAKASCSMLQQLPTHHAVRARIQQALDAAIADVARGMIVKPIACEPQRVVVGGDFAASGF